MDHRNLDKAMEIFACLITGETVGRENHRDLYEAYSSQAEVYDILDAVLKKSNLRLYEYHNTLYVTAGDENRVFGYTNDELKKAIDLALENDRKVVFEAFVDGQEVECAVIGSDPAVATRPGEILAGAEFYTYDDKYKNGVSQTVIPAHLPEEKLDEVKTYAAMAYTALGCEGLARCDFFVEKGTGRVMINEINTFPGFTSISMYPKLMEHEGLPVPALIDRLIELALERTEKQHG